MKKILIIKLGALGDVVMATPLIDAIMHAHASDAVHLLTTPGFAALFGAWPALRVTSFDRHGWRNNLAALRWLRQAHFDRIYDLQSNDRTMLWCALSGARERVGNHSRYPYTHHPETPWRGQSHIFARMCAVLASAGIRDVRQTPVLPCDSQRQDRVRTWLAGHGLAPRRYVLMHAGASASRPAKRWPHFAALAAHLRAAGVRVVWLGSEPERALNASLRKEADVDATGLFDILELAEVGRSARCAVTNDSGPMHVLAAADIPVYALFGPSDWRRNHALGQAGRVFACVDYDARHAGAACADCLAAVSAEIVFARLVADGVLNVEAHGGTG